MGLVLACAGGLPLYTGSFLGPSPLGRVTNFFIIFFGNTYNIDWSLTYQISRGGSRKLNLGELYVKEILGNGANAKEKYFHLLDLHEGFKRLKLFLYMGGGFTV